MLRNLNAVKTAAAVPRKYHHGDLRTSLIKAALEIIVEVGPDAFSLRAAAMRIIFAMRGACSPPSRR
jgi:hypothetical protein